MNRLIAAILEDDRSAVKTLLQADSKLVARPIRHEKPYDSGVFHWIYVGDTALHLAAAGYRAEIVELLLTSGSDPNAAQNRRRSTPLHYAADGFITGPAWNATRQVETLQCLLSHGANLLAQDRNGATALHRAVRTRCPAAVGFLLRAGSDPAIRNKSGSTPFHLAVQNTGRGGTGAPAAVAAQREIIEAFLSCGISPGLRDGNGESVADCAQSVWIANALH